MAKLGFGRRKLTVHPKNIVLLFICYGPSFILLSSYSCYVFYLLCLLRAPFSFFCWPVCIVLVLHLVSCVGLIIGNCTVQPVR